MWATLGMAAEELGVLMNGIGFSISGSSISSLTSVFAGKERRGDVRTV